MNQYSIDYSKQRAYAEFVNKLNARGGFIDPNLELQSYEKCRAGSGNLIVSVTGIRGGEATKDFISSLGYDSDYQNDPINDILELVIYIPFVEKVSQGKRFPTRKARKSSCFKISPTYSIFALCLLMVIGLSQTPASTLYQIFG